MKHFTAPRWLSAAPSTAAVTIVGVSAVVVAAGAAYAAWTVSGTGSTTGTAATISALNVTATITTNLYPGATSPVSVTVSNPNSFPVSLTSLTFGAVTSGSPVNCLATNVTTTNPSSFSMTIAAGASSTQSVANAVSMASGAPTACAGVSFTIPATATGTSA